MLIVMFKISKTAIPKSLWWFIGAILLQGVVGYVQVFNGLPEVLVAIHLLGSGLVWCAACYLNTGIKKG
jgi:cytochrome c oxidase assembly protein subunit 15